MRYKKKNPDQRQFNDFVSLQDWALVVYKNNDLVEIGLTGLTRILRGGVRVSKNARLCYADSIDWDRMTHP